MCSQPAHSLSLSLSLVYSPDLSLTSNGGAVGAWVVVEGVGMVVGGVVVAGGGVVGLGLIHSGASRLTVGTSKETVSSAPIAIIKSLQRERECNSHCDSADGGIK